MRKTITVLSTAALVAAFLPAPAHAAGFGIQQLVWAPCTDIPDPGALECATFDVPRDWNRPDDGKRFTISVSRLKPKGPGKGVLFTNPGGPGDLGRELPLELTHRARLVDNLEIVGIDVRGTSPAHGISCGGHDFADHPDPRDRSPRGIRAVHDKARDHARLCRQRSGEAGRYITTEQTVKDLDLLRRLMKVDKVDWLGYSGGTWLGAYYTAYFPRSVGRFVLDSTFDVTGTFQGGFAEIPRATERRFRADLLPWIARNDATYHLGTTPEQVRGRYETTRASLAADPVELPDGTLFTAMSLDRALTAATRHKEAFPQAAAVLAGEFAAFDPGSPDASRATAYMIMCNDTPFRGGPDFLAEESARLGGRYPLNGYYQPLAPCAFWDRPSLTLKTPTGQGVPPVLFVQTERDPATPVEGARRTHARFAGSRMLTVDDGDHTVYGYDNACVNDAVEDFLVDGTLPTRDTTCPGTPIGGA
ncbi:alpha/beta hydrolase [Saccharothrix violaceirubra]|uniref:Pimeloyl-ACP methyl ester carboxylesterase n=1 Tax=Saccharothrix violaceirubra TaxID=413306 RepID=A0A7W7T1J9_9PSEU|nr:alpha/beta hydrolase [Saccharothrix violaceirubra]MBB4963630.1 pimeloyl-ACP methyl ester carboxylesterase [Saccharothrix violaceirubra]